MHGLKYVAGFHGWRASVATRLIVASVVASWTCQIVGAAEPGRPLALTLALDDLQRHLIQPEWPDSLPPATSLGVDRIVAFEDHAYFAYLSGAVWNEQPQDAAPPSVFEAEILRRVIFIRPGIVVIDDQVGAQSSTEVVWNLVTPIGARFEDQDLVVADDGAQYRLRSVLPETVKWRVSRSPQQQGLASHTVLPAQEVGSNGVRILHVLNISSDNQAAPPTWSVDRDEHGLQLELIEQAEADDTGRVIRLWIPNGPVGGKLEIVDRRGLELIPKRPLPAGVLPPGLSAAQRRLQWDLPYRIEGGATWDTKQPSSELRRLVESGRIKPSRAVEIGCGTGNDAIYLASQGFDVTAIDISPTALMIAEKKAEESGVEVQWLLADILQPPLLKDFDFVYDRGCYHEIRQAHAAEYVAAVRELTHNGSQVLILAGNANKDSYWSFHGPPRVKEEEIRTDFATGFRLLQLSEFRFDPAPPEQKGALAWSILLRRDEQSTAISDDATR